MAPCSAPTALKTSSILLRASTVLKVSSNHSASAFKRLGCLVPAVLFPMLHSASIALALLQLSRAFKDFFKWGGKGTSGAQGA